MVVLVTAPITVLTSARESSGCTATSATLGQAVRISSHSSASLRSKIENIPFFSAAGGLARVAAHLLVPQYDGMLQLERLAAGNSHFPRRNPLNFLNQTAAVINDPSGFHPAAGQKHQIPCENCLVGGSFQLCRQRQQQIADLLPVPGRQVSVQHDAIFLQLLLHHLRHRQKVAAKGRADLRNPRNCFTGNQIHLVCPILHAHLIPAKAVQRQALTVQLPDPAEQMDGNGPPGRVRAGQKPADRGIRIHAEGMQHISLHFIAPDQIERPEKALPQDSSHLNLLQHVGYPQQLLPLDQERHQPQRFILVPASHLNIVVLRPRLQKVLAIVQQQLLCLLRGGRCQIPEKLRNKRVLLQPPAAIVQIKGTQRDPHAASAGLAGNTDGRAGIRGAAARQSPAQTGKHAHGRAIGHLPHHILGLAQGQLRKQGQGAAACHRLIHVIEQQRISLVRQAVLLPQDRQLKASTQDRLLGRQLAAALRRHHVAGVDPINSGGIGLHAAGIFIQPHKVCVGNPVLRT